MVHLVLGPYEPRQVVRNPSTGAVKLPLSDFRETMSRLSRQETGGSDRPPAYVPVVSKRVVNCFCPVWRRHGPRRSRSHSQMGGGKGCRHLGRPKELCGRRQLYCRRQVSTSIWASVGCANFSALNSSSRTGQHHATVPHVLAENAGYVRSAPTPPIPQIHHLGRLP